MQCFWKHGAAGALLLVVVPVYLASGLQLGTSSARRTHSSLSSTQPEVETTAVSACLEHFYFCWDSDKRLVANVSDCKDFRASCQNLLCTGWLPGACNRGDPACKEVAELCLTAGKPRASNASSAGLPLLFMHMPKNAGTAVEESGIRSNVKWGRFMTWGSVQMPDGYWCNAWHVPPVYLPDPRIYMNAEVFCVVRHPFDRLISEYKYLLDMPWGDNYVHRPQEPDQCHPKGLNAYLKGVMSAVNAGYPFINDCHLVKQSAYIWGHDRQWCQDIIRIENLPEEFESLMKRAGYPVTLARSKENLATHCPNLTRDSLDPELKQMVLRYYKDDFELLNYTID